MKVRMISHSDMVESLIATAAKMCYSVKSGSEIIDSTAQLSPEEISDYIEMLRNIGHESPLEHLTFTFSIEGISRACSHQLVRHRLASYSQKSQRYVKEDGFKFVTPHSIARSRSATQKFCKLMAIIADAYTELRDELTLDMLQASYPDIAREDLLDKANPDDVKAATRCAQEDSRYVLPNACETQLIMTMNARELLHFFRTRCCNRAQWEIREIADEMLTQCKQVAPDVFANAGAPCVSGKCPEGKMSCGHPRA